MLRVTEISLKKNDFLYSTLSFDISDVFVIFLLQHVCSELNWSCNFESFDGKEVAAAVTDESMDVTDDFSHKELEEMFKEYIVIMEV